jgi:hypothetical protein
MPGAEYIHDKTIASRASFIERRSVRCIMDIADQAHEMENMGYIHPEEEVEL